ncbi:IS630 family transposase [Acaryochloris sp. CCMEE 5410]|uniref:IS630 family transposase n=1 Tax=Acaryochloris sp. CCMEE 5410 TaxID=310037 RepID=UPI0002484B8F|nr:IS630 family transposase [Acaryochloris sp. CCMEE 5410]KAI9130731.1 IS630 family transposase [Acaryochloris sp. CCMEE 5410]
MNDVALEDLVFLDETGVNLAMVPLYGRAQQGHRVYNMKPNKRGINVTLIGAMALRGVMAILSFDGGTTGDIYRFYVRTVLVPQLWKGAVVVMDNLPAHKVDGIRTLIEDAGAKLVYLSPYSPDFNPIEHCWSKLKTYLRKVKARVREGLDEALTAGLELIESEDIRNWFAHCYCHEPL